MKFLFLALLFSSQISYAENAPLDTKSVASDMTVMTRSIDVLMGYQEMKDSVVVHLVRNALQSSKAFQSNPDADKKVAIITNVQSLEHCQIAHNETRSKAGDKVDAMITYKGTDCPIAVTVDLHILATGTGSDGTANLQLEILDEKLKNELDLTKFNMPMKINVTAMPTKDGFSMKSDMTIAANMQSQKFGSVDYSADLITDLVFGQSTEANANATEVFTSGGQKIKFVTLVQGKDNQNTETYFINDISVSQAEFEKQHASIILPGFDDHKTPLATAQTCEVKAYDSSIYSLEVVRKNIQNNTADTMKTSEAVAPMTLVETGTTQADITLSNQALQMTVSTTPDVARFTFEKSGVNGAAGENLGKLTAVFGEKVELTKQILNRIVRITCMAKK